MEEDGGANFPLLKQMDVVTALKNSLPRRERVAGVMQQSDVRELSDLGRYCDRPNDSG